jgi:DNA-binding response OmpR family regulator
MKKERIVIIDDSEMILKLTKTALEAAGFVVQALDNPGDFAPSEDPPDLILVDVNMPQFFGDDVVTYLRDEWSISTPIYLFSSVAEAELERRANDCGAQGYISKNWGLDVAVRAVEHILGTPAGLP